jgi:hypothetical protein
LHGTFYHFSIEIRYNVSNAYPCRVGNTSIGYFYNLGSSVFCSDYAYAKRWNIYAAR